MSSSPVSALWRRRFRALRYRSTSACPSAAITGPQTPLPFRQLEYYRMPLMAYLAVEHPERLTRGDFARLAYATAPGDRHALPFSEEYLARFEENHCYDRYYDEARSGSGLEPP